MRVSDSVLQKQHCGEICCKLIKKLLNIYTKKNYVDFNFFSVKRFHIIMLNKHNLFM